MMSVNIARIQRTSFADVWDRVAGLAAILGLLMMSRAGVVLAQPTMKEVVERAVPQSAEQKEALKNGVPTTAKPHGPEDELNRGTPRATMEGFLAAANDRDYERAAEYLDLRNLPRGPATSDGPQLARELRIVLDRTLWIDLADLSVDPKGHVDDGLPSYRDEVDALEAGGKKIDILLQRVPRADGVYIWKISAATVAQIPQLYEEYGYGYLGTVFPEAFFDFKLLGIEVWLWVGLIVTTILAGLASYLVTATIQSFLRRGRTVLSYQLYRLVRGPARLLLFVLVSRVLLDYINPPLWFRAFLQARTLLIVALVWITLWVVDLLFARLAERYERQGKSAAAVFLPPLGTGVKVILVIVATLLWLDNLGFEVTTLLAGLGIGGLAVALALQKPIENLLSAITLYTSQPAAVGDFCRFGDRVGTIEEIGLRATRIRTLDNTVVSVPNVELANLQLENYSKREKIWYHPQIRLRYETTPDQVRYILVEIRRILYAHPKVLPDPARIRFQGFGAYSLDLEVFAYVNVTDYGEFLEVAEDLNLRIMDVVRNAGTGFALPSQTLFVERGKEPDGELARAAEAQVKGWREQQVLYLPNFPREKIAELQGTLAYPPPGSAA